MKLLNRHQFKTIKRMKSDEFNKWLTNMLQSYFVEVRKELFTLEEITEILESTKGIGTKRSEQIILKLKENQNERI